jgi:hypothetical protein
MNSILRALPRLLVILTVGQTALAGPADVVGVKVTKSGPDVYSFAVTVRHDDGGWNIMLMRGRSLGRITR